MFSSYDMELAVGGELQVDHPLNDCWRIGGRIAGGAALNQKRTMWTIGIRVRNPTVSFGLDALGFGPSGNGARGNAIGAMGSVGFEGKPGRYVTGTLGVLLVIGAVVVVAAAPRT